MRLLYALLLSNFLLVCNISSAQDIAIAPASNKYKTSFVLRRLFIGNNYRDIWETPVRMPVFNINKEKGGLKITKLGGGAQTKSLRMVDRNNTEWVLRTVDKDVKGVMSPRFRNTFIRHIVQDMISTAHPYAPMVVGSLAKALNLDAPEPTLFFVTDDSTFGEYRSTFANKVCLFEQVAPARHDEFVISSDSMLYNLFQHPDAHSLEDTTLLRARLLDMLVADWDRHEDQYKWGYTRTNGKLVYYPIVRDRDQAFFYSDGLLLLQVRLFGLKFMTNFSKNMNSLRQLNNRSWLFDKLLLSRLNENDWRNAINNFQHTLNDSVLAVAVKQFPPEVYEKNGRLILEILKARRSGLMKSGMEYYEFLLSDKKLNSTSDEEKFKKIVEETPGKNK